MTGDLHIHSLHSHGTRNIPEILLLAKERGLSYLSIVDQNTTGGTAEAVATGTRMGLTVIPGVELLAMEPSTGIEVHILGYGYNLPADHIDALCGEVKLAATSDAPEPDAVAPDAAAVISAIHADGGLAVLAHPGQHEIYAAVDALVEAGLDGIELNHPDHGPDDHRTIHTLATRYGLFLTGGSDSGGVRGGQLDIGEVLAPPGTLHRLLRPENELIAWAESLVRTAGAMARRAVLSEIDTELKGGNIRDIVTEHDMAIDRFLTDSIRERFPDHGFVTEEYEHPPIEPGMPAWIIDPIDGTTNFVSTHSYFAVSLAHYRGANPVFGFVYDVMADELYLGIAGAGAWLNGRPLHTTPKAMHDSVIETSLICAKRLEEAYGADTYALARKVRAQRAYGSAAIGICRVAAGTLDMYVSCSLSLWDYAAAIIVLSEAGGRTAVDRHANLEPGFPQDPVVEPLSDPIFYHLDKRLFMAAGGESLIRELCALLFSGANHPSMGLLA